MARLLSLLAALALLPALGAGAALGADEAFVEPFDDNAHAWRLDDRWTLGDGALTAHGLADEVLAVGVARPVVSDFRAVLKARRVGGDENGSYGFLYRLDPVRHDGCFIAVSDNGGYGFGRVTQGEFTLSQRGASAALVNPAERSLELEVRGGVHTLRHGGTLVDIWQDDSLQRGCIGLLVVGAVDVAFDDLRVELLGAPAPPEHAADSPLGPDAPAGVAAGGQTAVPAAEPWLRDDDLALAQRWRGRWNRMAIALGDAPLPEALDAVDLAVLALLRQRAERGVAAPAAPLAELLREPDLVRAGARGSAPVAALTFWIDYAAAAPEAGEREQEAVLAGLTWFWLARTRTAAAWGDRGSYELVVTNELRNKLAGDRGRFEAQVPGEAERNAAHEAFIALSRDVRAAAQRLPATLPAETAAPPP